MQVGKNKNGFLASEEGAVTVDWVVLTSVVVSLGMAVGYLIWGNTGGAVRKVADYVSTQGVNPTFTEEEIAAGNAGE